ncbi:MAG: 16S rRNA (uracil(1498)-N(3))-methyltransferase [Gammaproteobacteria bacterium]|jgi:16S rRNA (uracil1498-N3)-methyltransferase
MRVPRIYIRQSLVSGKTLVETGQAMHHIKHVLRMRSGAALQVFDGSGREHRAILKAVGRSDIRIEIGDQLRSLAEPRLQLTLAQGIARHDRMDIILQKAVELGVSRIQPLWLQRSRARLGDERLQKRCRHWHGIVASACEQCGRATLPELPAPLDYTSWIAARPTPVTGLMLQPGSAHTLPDCGPPAGPVILLVGPEGGLNKEEQSLAHQAGFRGITLGQRTLRTETAAIAALAAIQTLWGDFRESHGSP